MRRKIFRMQRFRRLFLCKKHNGKGNSLIPGAKSPILKDIQVHCNNIATRTSFTLHNNGNAPSSEQIVEWTFEVGGEDLAKEQGRKILFLRLKFKDFPPRLVQWPSARNFEIPSRFHHFGLMKGMVRLLEQTDIWRRLCTHAPRRLRASSVISLSPSASSKILSSLYTRAHEPHPSEL